MLRNRVLFSEYMSCYASVLIWCYCLCYCCCYCWCCGIMVVCQVWSSDGMWGLQGAWPPGSVHSSCGQKTPVISKKGCNLSSVIGPSPHTACHAHQWCVLCSFGPEWLGPNWLSKLAQILDSSGTANHKDRTGLENQLENVRNYQCWGCYCHDNTPSVAVDQIYVQPLIYWFYDL